MAKAITCESCGAKFRADRRRCPRCRAVIVVPDLVAEAAASRKLLRAVAVVVGVFIAIVGFLWVTRDPRPAATEVLSRPADKVSPPQPPGQAAVSEPHPVPGAAFLDPSGAGALAYRDKDYQTALEQFQAAVQKNPNDAESVSNLGQVLVRLSRPADAIPHFERATTLNPDRWAYRFNLARALGLLGRWEESIASYQQAQRLFPDDYVTTFNLALAHHKAGDEAGAIAQYRRAIELQPEDASFRMALAISYERTRRTAEAIAAYSEYLRLAPSGPDADQVRARIAYLSGPTTP